MTKKQPHTPAGSEGLGKKLFSFVVYTDSHLNQSEHESMSPHEVNKLANGRHRHVIDEINRIAPDFAIHLGDLVHPVPVMGIYADAAKRFHEQVSELNCPLHIIPGNHDVGDKPIRWGPAETVSEQSLELWEKHFGPHYHSFSHEGCRFILLNAQIINSGLAAEADQREWLEAKLESAGSERIFVGIHYPPFIHQREELEYYDNIAEPGRTWLVDLVERYGVEAMFSGHVHNFWYHTIGKTAFYILPSITFVRHDYSELSRVPPGPEAGRNDAVKLGFMTVDVYERGHLSNPVRSYGKMRLPEEPPHTQGQTLPPLHPLQNHRANLGFDLRQPWAEIVEIPPNGGLDEFARKVVRNDYPLLALWEMGIRKVRVPFQDFLDERLRDRMQDLKSIGMEFSIFSYKLPAPELLDLIAAQDSPVSAWELAVPPEEMDDALSMLAQVKSKSSASLYLSRLRSKDDMETDGQRYYHVINHGYVPSEADSVRELASRNTFRAAADGFVFRVPRERPAYDEILSIGELTRDIGISSSVHLRLATSNPAGEALNDAENANRVAEAMAASVTQPHLSVYVDTLADVDRGYFVRNGIIDRRYNPRLAHSIVRNLYALFDETGGSISPAGFENGNGDQCIGLSNGNLHHLLVLPSSGAKQIKVPEPVAPHVAGAEFVLTDLASGTIESVDVQQVRNGRTLAIKPDVPGNPFVLTIRT